MFQLGPFGDTEENDLPGDKTLMFWSKPPPRTPEVEQRLREEKIGVRPCPRLMTWT